MLENLFGLEILKLETFPLVYFQKNIKMIFPFQIWCGAGVNLSGGKTRDGGSMVGGSVFYAAEARESNSTSKTEAEDAVEHLDKELQESEQRRLEAERLEQQLSSLVWICTSTQKMSKVTVIDANNPADILEVFNVCQSHLLCIASVPGAKESDYVQGLSDETLQNVSVVDGSKESSKTNEIIGSNNSSESIGDRAKTDSETQGESSSNEKVTESSEKPESEQNSTADAQNVETNADGETINLGKVHFIKNVGESSQISEETETSEKEATEEDQTPIEKMSSIQPTMWLGAQNGAIFVHSAVAKWAVCLHSVKLKDAALAIV